MISIPPTAMSPILPYAVWRMKNPPGAHSYTSLAVIFSGDVPSFGIVWPSVIHFPMKTSSRSYSGPRARAFVTRPGATPVTDSFVLLALMIVGPFQWVRLGDRHATAAVLLLVPPSQTFGCLLNQPAAVSYWSPSHSASRSAPGFSTICRPSGNPLAANPQGTLMAGSP